MEILIRNGERIIKGSVADRKAFMAVQASLESLEAHAGGELAEQAGEAVVAVRSFLADLDTAGIVWAPERVKTEPAK